MCFKEKKYKMTKKRRFKLVATVHLLLIKENELLLLRRYNTGYQDGKFSVIAGHLEENETVVSGMAREAFEEAGIIINPNDLQLVHVMHRKYDDDESIDFYFITSTWDGVIRNMEPNKCDYIGWVDKDNLPDNMVNHVEKAIQSYFNNINYSNYGWDFNN